MKTIGTSIYIENTRSIQLKKAVEKLNITEAELLSVLIARSRSFFGNTPVTGTTVKYQNNDCSSGFHVRHVEFYASDYEYITSRRYVFKISVSFIIRLAIDYFLSDIIYEWTRKKNQISCRTKTVCN